jgi:uncharacterized protein
MSNDPSAWAHLRAKYENPDRPHRVLSLDGGGIRGLITLQVLATLEAELRQRTGTPNLLLGDWFDLIGGTSTGAILAAGLSRGMSVAELQNFYVNSASEMFTKTFFLQRFNTKFNEHPIQEKLREVFGTDSGIGLSESTAWKCLFVAMTMNWTTLSPWPISNNPFAKYNELSRSDCNLKVPLWQLVRASTAAPTYFVPEVIQWDPNDATKRFVFVDGGMTSYNNPASQLFRMCTAPPYKLSWPTGEKKLLVISVGTGLVLSKHYDVAESGDPIWTNAANIPTRLMDVINVEQDLNCRTIGRCFHGDVIDREVGDMIPTENGVPLAASVDLGRMFSYARFNADLSQEGLQKLGLNGLDSGKVSKLDCVEESDNLIKIGQAVAKQVSGALMKFSSSF